MSYVVAAFYHFAPLAPEVHREAIAERARRAGVRGTILLAPEGVNGTIAGERVGIDAVLAMLRGLPGFADLDWKESAATEMPFRRLKVRLKKEIVTLGVEGVDPNREVGAYVEPEDWNALVDDPGTVVIDTRNDYEVQIGTFAGAVDPETASFRDFPAWWQANKTKFEGKRIAMFCTGGIRCEKASSYLLGEGVPEVRHLKGGILKYLERVAPEETRWDGECFVFDARVAVGHGLAEGDHALCHACGRPVSAKDRMHPDYVEGISCPACIHEYTDEDRARFAERQKQTQLARERGLTHLAGDLPAAKS